MPAPYGIVLTDSPEYTSNEVYRIDARDPCQGAGTGALFSGIGIQNQPHQQLANRTAFLKGRQDTNITNISALQAFEALFTGSMGGFNGYIKIPFQDTSLGAIVAIVQWGFYSWFGLAAAAVENAFFNPSFPIPFPNNCMFMLAALATTAVTGGGGLVQCALNLEPVGPPYTKTQAQVFSDWNDQSGSVITIANSSNGGVGLTGFNWLAIGY